MLPSSKSFILIVPWSGMCHNPVTRYGQTYKHKLRLKPHQACHACMSLIMCLTLGRLASYENSDLMRWIVRFLDPKLMTAITVALLSQT